MIGKKRRGYLPPPIKKKKNNNTMKIQFTAETNKELHIVKICSLSGIEVTTKKVTNDLSYYTINHEWKEYILDTIHTLGYSHNDISNNNNNTPITTG